MEEVKHTPDEHSDIVGGSTAARVIACPKSVTLEREAVEAHKQRIIDSMIKNELLPVSMTLEFLSPEQRAVVDEVFREEDTSSAAKEGTGLHEAMAWILENDEEPESVVDRTFEGVLITPTLYSEGVLPAIQMFDKYLDLVEEEDKETVTFLVEKRCQIPGLKGVFGTSDIIIKTSKRIIIWDWKFGGAKQPAAFENKQLQFYGRAAVNSYFDWFNMAEDPNKPGQLMGDTRVELIICAPRSVDEIDVHVTDYSALEAFRMELIRAVSEALGDAPELHRGAHCKYCKAKPTCPAHIAIGERIFGHIDKALDKTPDATIGEAIEASAAQFTPEDLHEMYLDVKDYEEYAKAIHNLVDLEVAAGRGGEVLPFKHVNKYSNRAWVGPSKTIDRRLHSKLGLSVNDRRDIKPISPAQAEKLVPHLKEEIKAMTERNVTGTKLVALDHKDEAVTPLVDKMKAIAEKLPPVEEQ